MNWIFWAFLAIAGFFLVAEHRAHVIEYLPFILLLACPLLHLFHGHGGHAGDKTSGESADAQKSKRPSDPAPGGKDPGSEQHHHH